MTEYRVEQLARDAKSLMIYAGSNEVQITHVARGLLADSTSGRCSAASCPCSLVEADCRRSGHIQTFCAAGHLDPHPVVGQPRNLRRQPLRLRSEQPRSWRREHGLGLVQRQFCVQRWWPAPAGRRHAVRYTRRARVRFDDHREREDAARRGAHTLAVVGIDTVSGDHHRAGPHGVRDADQRADVTRFGQPTATATSCGAWPEPGRASIAGRSHTAISPTGVTVSDNAFAARSVTRCTRDAGEQAPMTARRRPRWRTTRPRSPRRNAASTRWGPSARKRPARFGPRDAAVWPPRPRGPNAQSVAGMPAGSGGLTGRGVDVGGKRGPWPPRPAR